MKSEERSSHCSLLCGLHSRQSGNFFDRINGNQRGTYEDSVKKTAKDVSEIPSMDDEELERFWEAHSPEDFQGWTEGGLKFTRPAKRLIQLRLDPKDIRVIDRESRRSGIDRAQLVRSWVKEKIRDLEAQK
jgi:hypothetical protein